MNSLWQDIRYALRVLAKQPGFTLIVVLTLALGIGANTAIFSGVNTGIPEPLPFPESKQLVEVKGVDIRAGEIQRPLSYLDFVDYRAQNRSLESVAAYDKNTFTLTGNGEPLHIEAGVVSADFFQGLRASPMLGRPFGADDEKPGTRVAILSHQLWQSRFGANPAIVGSSITLDTKAYAVVGVMGSDFQFPLSAKP